MMTRWTRCHRHRHPLDSSIILLTQMQQQEPNNRPSYLPDQRSCNNLSTRREQLRNNNSHLCTLPSAVVTAVALDA
jgi:hypothetical protein